jgi:hypothetical protein
MKEELMAGQRNLEKLTRVYLPDAGVASVGPQGEVAQRAGAVAVLDLQARRSASAARCDVDALCVARLGVVAARPS